ncbi:hypothetical protein DRO03_01295 [Methanosarcinales archaeon]|nr:MAG: hypothetical protein DRO03_01295 [Methanosarcinales archaeon]
MIALDYTVSNLRYMSSLSFSFEELLNGLERTADGVFRRVVPPLCPECGVLMNRNSYNTYCKKYMVASIWGGISVPVAMNLSKKTVVSEKH